MLLDTTAITTNTFSDLLNPAVIAAIIGAIISIPGFFLNYQNARIQRQKSKRDEIYKKLNSFYGPMRLQLKISKRFYTLFSESVKTRLVLSDFKTLPFILDGNHFSKTEKKLFEQILDIGSTIEEIIENNAGLIDSEGVHDEMVSLGTHLKIIREAYFGKYDVGIKKLVSLQGNTFPDIEDKIDSIFNSLKKELENL